MAPCPILEPQSATSWPLAPPAANRELRDLPRTVKTLRPGRQGEGVVITDGPYIETKELLGGFVILEADSMDQALAIASEWPSLTTQAHATVQLQPVFQRD